MGGWVGWVGWMGRYLTFGHLELLFFLGLGQRGGVCLGFGQGLGERGVFVLEGSEAGGG